MIPAVMALLAVGSSALLVRSLLRARRAGHVDASTALVLGMGWLYAMPLAVVAFSGSLRRQPDVFGAVLPVYPGWYSRASQLGILLVGALAVALLVGRVRRSTFTVNAAALAAIVLWSLASLAAGRTGHALVTGRAVVLLLCLLAAVVLPRGRGACLGVAVFGVTVAAASGLLAVVRHDTAFVVPCLDACGGLGFNGIVPNPDLLGDILAVTVPFCFLGFQGAARYWFAGYVTAMTAATGSITASGAALFSLGLALVLRPSLDSTRTRPLGTAVVGGAVALTAATSAVVVTHQWGPHDLSGRVALWRVALHQIQAAPWLGYGAGAWSDLHERSQIPYADLRSTHNQWLDVLFTTGVVGAAVLVAVVVVLAWSAGPARLAALFAISAVATVGIAEPAWIVGSFDVLSFSLVAALLVGPGTGTRAAPAFATGAAT